MRLLVSLAMTNDMFTMDGRQSLQTPQWQGPRLLSVICHARLENIHGTRINLFVSTPVHVAFRIPDQIKLGANCVSMQLRGRP
ncbi:hypothetical protein FR483_n774L [Paramecium bursaria Chlorella virus FR483]|uniref:Uncharacterized protein n774L n=1 Tax=Paramecium bursaria Chlorella virus FR483 TaxID=399781 RepID=A7J8C8_PBCVF|nr:hypothetical protein FR483_n774L [Paramecium bursaria Chlorella virus FR483]ABT16059.1 hypothetical protein FR483_n774L [Paramecium bursaria Chlorella virus FR483]